MPWFAAGQRLGVSEIIAIARFISSANLEATYSRAESTIRKPLRIPHPYLDEI